MVKSCCDFFLIFFIFICNKRQNVNENYNRNEFVFPACPLLYVFLFLSLRFTRCGTCNEIENEFLMICCCVLHVKISGAVHQLMKCVGE